MAISPDLPKLSRLMLGTVQFGMPYGVANRVGQPSYDEVREIVRTAVEGGVNCLDTAAAYGSSEEVLGRVLADLNLMSQVVVVTKVRALTDEELGDEQRAVQAIEQSVEQSRRRLRVACLPLVLFHREADARYLPVLERLRSRGWLLRCGVSCDNAPQPATRFAAMPGVTALQLPANLLDPRHLASGVLEIAAREHVQVFIRSALLQGLLAMPEESVPKFLQPALPVRRELGTLAAEAGLTLPELALRFLLTYPAVTSVLVGVETVAQMKDNLATLSRGPLPEDLAAAVRQCVPQLPEALITPRLWPTDSR